MNNLEQELLSLGIHITYLEIDEPGCFITEKNLMVVSNKLSEEEATEVIYHELGHLLLHSDKVDDYKNPSRKICMENDANAYLIERMADDHDGYVNIADAIAKYHLAIGWDIGMFRKAK